MMIFFKKTGGPHPHIYIRLRMVSTVGLLRTAINLTVSDTAPVLTESGKPAPAYFSFL